MTAAIHTPVSLHPEVTSGAWTTPRRLRVAAVALAIVAVVAGVVGGVAMLSRQQAANTAVSTAEPLVVDAQKVDVYMSAANTTIAGGFLAGPVVPQPVQSLFDQDMSQAAAALTAASQRAGTGSAVSSQLSTLTSGLSVYEEKVATAEDYNRQGFPLGAAYLDEANNLMQTKLLTAATGLYGVEQARLSHDDNRASGSTLVVVVLVLLTLVLLATLLLHLDVSRRFRRVLNIGLATAILLVIAVGVWAVVAAVASGRAVAAAEHRGSAPLAVLTRARILAQQARADDELTLVTRDTDPADQQGYASTAASLASVLRTPGHGWTSSETADLSRASTAWNTYAAEHNHIRQSDQGGDLLGAISADHGSAAPAAAAVDAPLSAGVSTAVTSFARNDRSASNDLDGLALGCLLLMVIAAAAVLIGVEPRIREYR
jgi:hypothetical protein